jgi:peptidyl-Asp metalloendopeptidase
MAGFLKIFLPAIMGASLLASPISPEAGASQASSSGGFTRSYDGPRLSAQATKSASLKGLLLIPIFGAETLAIEQVDSEFRSSDGTGFLGRIVGDPYSAVSLTDTSAGFVGSISGRDKSGNRFTYLLAPSTSGGTRVKELDTQEPLSEHPATSPAVPASPPLSLDNVAREAVDDQRSIDVAVVYTPNAAGFWGSASSMESVIRNSVLETNNVFANSGIPERIRLVGVTSIPAFETGNSSTDLVRLATTNDGFSDSVHQYRDSLGADLVVGINNSLDSCGVGYVNTPASSAVSGFSVVNARCMFAGDYTFAHELGHNLGANHAAGDPLVPASYPFAYGYKDPALRFRTVMAYNCVPSCPRIPYFSSPRVQLNGVPVGVAEGLSGAADNAKAIGQMRSIVANFRTSITAAIFAEEPLLSANGTAHALVTNSGASSLDWIGLYRVGEPNSAYLGWQYLSGSQTPPSPSIRSARLTFLVGTPGTYEFRLFSNNTTTLVTKSDSFSVLPPSINLQSIGPVGSTVALGVGPTTGSVNDWVGTFPIGAPDSLPTDRVYLNGLSSPPGNASFSLSNTVTLALPQNATTLEARYFSGITGARLATITLAPAPTLLNVLKAVRGQRIQVGLANGPKGPLDWIGIYDVSNPNVYVAWSYLNSTKTPPSVGLANATLSFDAPNLTSTYVARFFPNNGGTAIATSPNFALGSPGLEVVAFQSIRAGQPMVVRISQGHGSITDWVGLYPAGAPDNSYINFVYTTGTYALPPAPNPSSTSFEMAAPLTSGIYELRLFANNGFQKLDEFSFEVKAPVVSIMQSSRAGFAQVFVNFGPGGTTDRLAIFDAANPTVQIDWKYLNDSKIPPAAGLTGGNAIFEIPNPTASYVAKFFPGGTTTAVATTPVFSANSPGLHMNTFAPSNGKPLNVSIDQGIGSPTDWVGIFPAGAPDNAYLRFAYATGTYIPPTTVIPFQSVSFSMQPPSIPGSYELRMFSRNGVTKIDQTVPFNVLAASFALSGNARGDAQMSLDNQSIERVPSDTIRFYEPGVPDSAQPFDWMYLNGTKVQPTPPLYGIPPFFLRPGTAPYEARYFREGSATSIATVSVQPSLLPVFGYAGNAGGKLSVYAGRNPITTTDWFGLYQAGAPDNQYLDWAYSSGTKVPPSIATPNIEFKLQLPEGVGTYEVRWFTNNSYTRVGMGGPFSVLPNTVSAIRLAADLKVTVQWGPGNLTDWVGVFPVGASAIAAPLSRTYLNGSTTTPPTVGISDAIVNFPLPPVGSYEIRLMKGSNPPVILAASAI